jgi:hypothetical protein
LNSKNLLLSNPKSSNLARIFGITSVPAKIKERNISEQQSLRYVPPAEKDINENQKLSEQNANTEAKADWLLLEAKAVTAYKL